MIDDVINDLFEKISPDLLKTIKQEKAAREYAEAKERRKEDIAIMSGWVYDAFLQEQVKTLAMEVYLHEKRVRHLARQAVRHWKAWARWKKETREAREKLERETFARLSKMGLEGTPTTIRGAIEGQDGQVRRGSEMGDLDIDVELREVSRVDDDRDVHVLKISSRTHGRLNVSTHLQPSSRSWRVI
jgi:hypothetical protein